MLDLETRLREQFHDEVDDLVPSDRLDALVVEHRQRHIRRQRLGFGGVVVLSIAAVVLVAALLPRTGPAPVVAGTKIGDTLFLVPQDLPEGFKLLGARGGDRPDLESGTVGVMPYIDDWDHIQRWVRFAADGEHPAEIITVVWGRTAEVWDTDGPLSSGAVQVTLSNNGSVYFDAATGRVYSQPVGDSSTVLSIQGWSYGAAPGPMAWEQLAPVFDSLQPRDDGWELTAPPEGFEQVGDSPAEPDGGTNLRMSAYGLSDERGFNLLITDGSDRSPGVGLDSDKARQVEVRGQPAVIPSDGIIAVADADPTWPSFGGEIRNLIWAEPTGETVIISATGMTDDEIIAVANSLEAVDGDTWFGLQRHDPAKTTAPAAAGATTTTTSSTPPAEPLHVEGTYEGTDNYGLRTEGPCDLVHDDKATFTLSDGRTWELQHDQCATTEADSWSATGTFTLTTQDGDTLTGTSNQKDIELPTEGEPYDLTITGGTGRFAGASGSCRLDNHVEVLGLGRQIMEGPFTCDFVP